MPIATTLALAGGALTGGGLLGSFLNRPEVRSPDDFDLGGQSRQLQQTIEQFRDPSRQRRFFERLLEDRGPSKSDLLSAAAATGGSQAAATRQFRAQQRRTQDQISRQATQSFLNQQSLLADLVSQQAGLRQQRNLAKARLSEQSRRRREDSTLGIFNQITSAGTGLLGSALGQNLGSPNQGRQEMPGVNPRDLNQGINTTRDDFIGLPG